MPLRTPRKKIEIEILKEIAGNTIAFLFKTERSERYPELELVLDDPKRLRMLLSKSIARKANEYFEYIDYLPAEDGLTKRFGQHTSSTLESLRESGFIEKFTVPSGFHPGTYYILRFEGLAALLPSEKDSNGLVSAMSRLLVTDKIAKMNSNIQKGIDKKEFAILLIILIYFESTSERPLRTRNKQDVETLTLIIEHMGRKILDNFTCSSRLMQDLRILRYYTNKAFHVESLRKSFQRDCWVEYEAQEELDLLCTHIVASLTSGFSMEEQIKKLLQLETLMLESLSESPVSGSPVTIRDMLRTLGIDEFDPSSKGKQMFLLSISKAVVSNAPEASPIHS